MTTTKSSKLPAIFIRDGGPLEPWHCHRCGNPVRLENAVVLEESGRSCEFHDFGMPEDESTGLALFGKDCATQLRKRARHLHPESPAGNSNAAYQTMLQRLDGKHNWINAAYADCLREVLELNLQH